MKKSKPRQPHGTSAAPSDPEQAFLHHQGVFKDLASQVANIEAALKKYEKKVGAISPALTKVAESLSAFYAGDDLSANAESFSRSTSSVAKAIEGFSSDMAKMKEDISAYSDRIHHMKKTLSEHDKLHSKMKDKEKEAHKVTADPKADSKKTDAANEKATQARKEYNEFHDVTKRQLAEMVSSKGLDFEARFQLIAAAQRNLFLKMSEAFEFDFEPVRRETRTTSTSTASYASTSTLIAQQTAPSSYPPIASNSAPPLPSSAAPPLPTSVPPPVPSHPAPQVPAHSALPLPKPSPSVPARLLPSSAAPPPLPSRGTSPPVPARISAYHGKPQFSACPHDEREQYIAMFVKEKGSEEALMGGAEAFTALSKARLSQDDLAAIWELADQDHDGSLTCEEFTLCMYLINAKLRNKISTIPTTLTPELTIRAPPPLPAQRHAPAHPSSPVMPPRSTAHSRNVSGNIPSVSRLSGSQSPALLTRSQGHSPQIPARTFSNGSGNLQHDAETAAGAYAGREVGKAAMDRDNQKAAGERLANNTDNKALKFAARNKFVQKQAGKAVSDKANDPEFQQAIAKSKEGAKSGASYGASGAKAGASYGATNYAPTGF